MGSLVDSFHFNLKIETFFYRWTCVSKWCTSVCSSLCVCLCIYVLVQLGLLTKDETSDDSTEFIKELNLCHKLKFSNPYIYWTWCCRLLIFQTKIIWCNRTHSLKYLTSTTMGCRDIGIRKSEFVSKTQFLYAALWWEV